MPMTSNDRYDYIDKLVMIGYYWLSSENYNCPTSICNMLYQLDLTKRERKRVDDLSSDIKAMSRSSKNAVTNGSANIKIPENCKVFEDKLLWIVIMTLMNLFNSGDFEMGYTFLMDFTETWNDVYINMIPLLKTFKFRAELVNWAVTHFLFAKDIATQEEFSLYGYKITKE